MPSPEELRNEAHRLLERVQGFVDPTIRRELVSRAFELVQLAESIAELAADSERREPRIAQYRSMLKDRSLSQAQRRLIEDLLSDAEGIRTANKIVGRTGIL